MAVFGNAAYPLRECRARGPAPCRLASEEDRAALRLRGSGEQRCQRRLAVARYAGDAGAAACCDACEFNDRSARRMRHDGRHGDFLADHHRRQFGTIGLRRPPFAGKSACAQHQHAVADGHDFLKLVRDEDDGKPVCHELLQRAEKRFRFQRRQNRRGFVEDENAGLAIKRLQDLDALALAHGKIGDDRLRIDLEAERARHLPDPPDRAPPVEPQRPEALGSERDVFHDRHLVREREMLVDHADTGGQRRARVARRKLSLEHLDIPFVRHVVAEEDVH